MADALLETFNILTNIMKRIQCKCCGAPISEGFGNKICCPYCGTVFLLEELVRPDNSETLLFPSPIIDDWFCPFCNAQNPKQEEFCTKCGGQRTDPTKVQMRETLKTPTAYEIPYNSTRWRCSCCGTINDREFPFCCNCGEDRLHNL